jgi:phosphatidylserine decarboxylase
MRLHREGRFILFTSALLLVGVNILAFNLFSSTPWPWLSWLFLAISIALYALLLNFFRNPKRNITYDPQSVLAPCDGKVVVIKKVYDPVFFKTEMRQVSIFMSPLNVHVNRSPISGRVIYSQYYPGKYLVAWHPKSSTENEHTYFVFENGKGQIGCKQIAGALARRIKYYIQTNDEVTQGQEFGFIKFGSRVDLLLPLEYEICVSLGERARGGETVIAKAP